MVVDQRLTGGFARSYRQGYWRVVEGTGELDLQALPLLRDLCAGAPLHVVVDLRQVTFLDAAVLGLLVGIRADQRRTDSAVRLVDPPPMVRRMIAITGLQAVLPVCDTWELATAGHESCA